jgi:hypothetical protein
MAIGMLFGKAAPELVGQVSHWELVRFPGKCANCSSDLADDLSDDAQDRLQRP